MTRRPPNKLQRAAIVLLGVYAFGWLAFGVYIAIAPGQLGALIVAAVVGLVSLAIGSLGARRPLSAGTLMLFPVTFPFGLSAAAVSEVSSNWKLGLLFVGFAGAPFLIGVVFIAAAFVARRRGAHRSEIEAKLSTPRAS